MIMAVPLQTWVGKQFGRLRVQTAGKTDRRIRLMNEIVTVSYTHLTLPTKRIV